MTHNITQSSGIRCDRLAVAMGAMLDWYDFALFGFFSSIFSVLFFPSKDPHVSLILILGVWAISFFARPLGAIVFGYLGDQYGRAFCFKIVSRLVLVPACLFPFVPTYESIGLFSPIIVVTLRVMLGFCIGAEFAGNFVYQCESTPPHKTFFAASLGSCTGSAGILLASIAGSLTYFYMEGSPALQHYGWRLAFGFGTMLSLISFVLRRRLQETKVFQALHTLQKSQSSTDGYLTKVFLHRRSELLLALGIISLHAISFYFIFTFLPIYSSQYLHHSETLALQGNALILGVRIMIIPLWGMLADKIGGLRLLTITSVCFALLSFPLLALLESTAGTTYYCIVALLALMSSVNAGVVPGLLMRMLDPATAYSIMSLTFNIAFGGLGGLVPLLSIFLIDQTGTVLAPSFLLITFSLITLFSLHKAHHHYGKRLSAHGPA
jgi:MHS family proline/betaine transporter-like MFS transporter